VAHDQQKRGTAGEGEAHPTREELLQEVGELRERYANSTQYIRRKVNQLLTVMGTAQLRPEELDDATLIELDPIGIVSDSFMQILRNVKETNEQLRTAHDETEAIFDSAGMGILVLDRARRIIAWNKKLEDQFALDRSATQGRFCHELLCRVDHREDCPARKAVETERSCQQDLDLEGRHYNIVATPIKDKSGAVSRIVLVYMDMTERIFAQEELRRSEERYRDLFENSTDLIQVLGADSSIRYVNKAWMNALGYKEEELHQLSIFDLLDPECADCGPEFKSVVYGDKDGRFESTFITKRGGKIVVEGNVSAIIEGGRFMGTRGIFRDITERKRIETMVAAEREQLAVTLRSIGDGVITTDINGNVVLINKVAEGLTGWRQAEARGRPIKDVLPLLDEKTGEPRLSPVEQVLGTCKACELEGNSLLVARDGSRFLITDSVAPILDKDSVISGTVLVFRDITERRKLEDRINKSEKIESLGVLAGGIAHDFNNLLNAIIGNIDIGKKFSTPDSDVYKSLVRTEKASARAKELTQQLLTFSKGGAPVKKLAVIGDLIRDTADFGTRGSAVRCEFSLPEDLWDAEIDEGQISQVISNLVINAVQAMPRGGTIHISGRNVQAGPGELLDLKPGNYVSISVQDTGRGIPQEHIGRIFEPYFSTKEGGSGLGLATTYSIIKKHAGAIDVESTVGTGSTFTIFLPASPEHAGPAVRPSGATGDKQRAGRVLLMDDDEIVRETAGIMLDLLGYSVDFAADGNAAVEMYRTARSSKAPYDVVIMDLTIPGGKGGKDAIRDLLEIDPDAKAIVSSGYSNDAVMSNYSWYGFAGIIIKPYTMDELSEELQRIMRKKGPSGNS
jgi:PAS domain S-box-containing protein